MPQNSPVKKAKRQAISLDIKIKILDELSKGKGPTAVGRQFGIHEATVRTIKKNEIAIRKSVGSRTPISAKSSSYIRDVAKEKMENALVMWIEDQSQKRVPVDGISIKRTALRMYKSFKEMEPSTSGQTKQLEFAASTGWMMRFLKRHGLHNVKIKGDTTSADEWAPNEFRESGGYIPDQGCNANESGHLSKKMPNRTYVVKSQTLGQTIGEDGFHDILFSGAGDLLVEKSWCKNEIVDPTLSSYQDKVYSDTNHQDLLLLNASIIKEGLDLAKKLGNHFKQHDPDIERVARFQCELQALMASYRELYHNLARKENQSLMTEFLPKSTELLKQEIADDYPEIMSQDDDQTNYGDGTDIQSISLGENEIIDSTFEASHDRDYSDTGAEDAPILTAAIIKEGLDLARHLGNHFKQHDPDEDRVGKFRRELQLVMLTYKELYKDLSRNQTQSLMTDFLPKTTNLIKQETKDDYPEINLGDDSDLMIGAKRLRLLSESENA